MDNSGEPVSKEEQRKAKRNAYMRDYRRKNKDRLRKRCRDVMREYRKKNRERVNTYQAEWYRRNRSEILARHKAAYAADPQKYLDRNRTWREKKKLEQQQNTSNDGS